MKDRTLHRAFPIVAAAIGQRFGINVRVGGDQAYTNGGVIQLPAYDGDDPDYRDYAWGLLAHEAFHIRYSDFGIDYGHRAIRRRLCGAIEDVRIEYAGAKAFPGTRLTIRKVIDRMAAEGQFRGQSETDPPGDILHGYVLKRLRARVLGQTALNPLLAATEQALHARFPPGAVIRLKGLLSEVPDGLACERDCLALVDRILAMIEEEVRKEDGRQKKTSPEAPSNADASGLPPSEPDDASAAPAPGQAEEAVDDESDTSITPQVEADDSDNDAGVAAGKGDGIVDSQPEGDPEDTLIRQILETQEADLEPDVFEAVKALLKTDEARTAGLCLPNAEEPCQDEAAGWALYRKVDGESGKIRAALQGAVQSHRRNLPVRALRGSRIDARQLHRLPTGDARVFVNRAHRPNPNTAVHLLLDRSDSMGYPAQDTAGRPLGTRMPLALEAAMALGLALEGTPGVNPGITAFPGKDERSVFTVLRHGQRLKSRVGAFALKPDGGTPMAEGLWFAAAALLQCREPRKLLWVLTDGQPNEALATLDILDRCRRSGIEAVGVGLGIAVDHLFPKAIVIDDLRELRAKLFELAKELLTAA